MNSKLQGNSEQKTGLIGLFDILGYQSFATNNDVEDAVIPLLGALEKMPQTVRQLMEPVPEHLSTIVAETKSLVFSDTVLLTCPVEDNASVEDKTARWAIFTLQSALLQRKMFHFGFPVRGAISFGRFIHGTSCFSGRAIIEAYQLATKVDAAAIVFADSSSSQVKALSETNHVLSVLLSKLAVEYLVPVKNTQATRRRTVNFARLVHGDFPALTGDARELVSDCFWKHNKDLPQSAYEKVTNTELLLRYLRSCQ